MFWYKIHYSSVYVLDIWVLLSLCRYCSPLSSTFGFRERCWKVFKDVRLLAWLLKNWFGEKLENIHTQIQKQEAGTSPENLVTWVAVVIFFKRRQIWVSSVYPLSLIFTCIFCLSEDTNDIFLYIVAFSFFLFLKCIVLLVLVSVFYVKGFSQIYRFGAFSSTRTIYDLSLYSQGLDSTVPSGQKAFL